MNFQDIFNPVKILSAQLLNLILEENNYDAILVKKLASSNTGSATSHQSHIAFTGDEIGFFPLLYNNLYFKNNYSNSKRMFLVKIPLLIPKQIWNYMGINTHSDDISCFTHSILSRPDTPQLELGDSTKDSTEWKDLKNNFQANDYLVFLKYAGELKYKCLLIRNSDSANLQNGVATVDFSTRPAANNRTSINIDSISIPQTPTNKIYFGCPGTGKSYEIDKITKGLPKNRWERVTFHPEYDYASFVGAFKPISTKNDAGQDVIKYDFVPQAFTDIYIRAWQDVNNPYFLLIEEINRGNCAEIFGDIFQLLDRNANYEVSPSQELRKYIEGILSVENEGIVNGLKLPPNLSLYATMNTSDQSLFPMDSAFKRRWEWQYVPIDYRTVSDVKLIIADKMYSWEDFLRKMNDKIYHITESEDKQMGNFFVVPQEDKTVLKETLMNKVLFYLWFDVFKHEDSRSAHYVFKKSENESFKYADLFEEGKSDELLIAFMTYNNVAEMS